jgi:hypothetical protein
MLTEKRLTDKNAGAANAAPVFTDKMTGNRIIPDMAELKDVTF